MSEPNDPRLEEIAAQTDGLQRLQLIAESVVGYRRTLVDGGVSDETADAMCTRYHDVLLDHIKQTMQAAQAQTAAELLKTFAKAAGRTQGGQGGVFPKRGQ